MLSNETLEEQRWRLAIENATFGVWDLDPRLEMVHYSPQWKARLGFPRVHAPDSTAFWRCRVHPDDLAFMLGSLRSHIEGHSPSYEMRFRLRSNGSGYRTVLSRGRVVARDDRGNATRMVGTMVDLTGRPAAAAPHGLAAEDPEQTSEVPRLPLHAILGAHPHAGMGRSACETIGAGRSGAAQEAHRLVELIDDLLDTALREGTAML
jgi:PAS domain S-box-containing protein